MDFPTRFLSLFRKLKNWLPLEGDCKLGEAVQFYSSTPPNGHVNGLVIALMLSLIHI